MDTTDIIAILGFTFVISAGLGYYIVRIFVGM